MRKRSSSSEAEVDSVPLTKRIALLSVASSSVLNEDGMNSVTSHHQLLNNNYAPSCYTEGQHVQLPWQQNGIVYTNSCCHSNGVNGYYQPVHGVPPENFADKMDSSVYAPELDADANPEYYDINSVLFHAHHSRMQRLGHQLLPH